jgi:folate-binding protein YgfZ
MKELILQAWHQRAGARFEGWRGVAVVSAYGSWEAEYGFLRHTAGIIDLSSRSRLCVTGSDRERFLHGQVTNDVKRLKPGDGCYAALITAKGKMQSDLNIYCLDNEILLDFEPGLAPLVLERLQKFIIADDVQIVDVSDLYGVISVQGPRAAEVLSALEWVGQLPSAPLQIAQVRRPEFGESYVTNHARFGAHGFDVFSPANTLEAVIEFLVAAAAKIGGGLVGCRASELRRIESGIPRFGKDMDETNLPLEAGLEARAISFNKGCYIGQEVISRIRTYGQVTKSWRGLRFPADLSRLPQRGDKLLSGGIDAGYITSAAESPDLDAKIGLGYVRKEVNRIGGHLQLNLDGQTYEVQIVALPFVSSGAAPILIPS